MKNKLFIGLVALLVIAIVGYSYVAQFYVVPILMYHHVDEVSHDGTNNVLVDNFARQMKFLHRRGYNVISLQELVEGIQTDRKFPRNSVVITFDDGYENNYIHAFPHLKKYDFPAIIFISPDFIGRENFLTRDEILEMHKNNISFGGHSRTQRYLPEIKSKRDLINEIAGCKRLLEARFKMPVDYFCYPIGGFNEEIKKIVEESGYKAACTTNRGFDKLNRDLFELKRIKVTNSDASLIHFWGKLSGYYNLFRKPKNPD